MGGAGNDALHKGYGRDRLYGGPGRDFFVSTRVGPNARRIDGGSGRDRANIKRGERRVTVGVERY